MKPFVKEILEHHFPNKSEEFFAESPLISFLDSKMGAINGNSKSRRSFGTIYAIYSITNFYVDDFF